MGFDVVGFAVGLDMTSLALVGFSDVGINAGFKVGLVVCGVNGGPAQLLDILQNQISRKEFHKKGKLNYRVPHLTSAQFQNYDDGRY